MTKPRKNSIRERAKKNSPEVKLLIKDLKEIMEERDRYLELEMGIKEPNCTERDRIKYYLKSSDDYLLLHWMLIDSKTFKEKFKRNG
jgi:hypothetical protein